MSRAVVGTVPVGGIVSWLKNYTNVPSLPDEYVECNGQTLTDAQSVFNGQVIPLLNGTTDDDKRFLRGATTSGGVGGSSSVSHSHSLTTETTYRRVGGTWKMLSATTSTDNQIILRIKKKDGCPKVLAFVITKDYVKKECYESLLNQDYPKYDIMVHTQKPEYEDEIKYIEQSVNIAKNREAARKIALTSDAEYFLIIDSDIVIPKNAISEFVKQLTTNSVITREMKKYIKRLGGKIGNRKKHCLAGWYKRANLIDVKKKDKTLSDTWIMVNFVADNKVFRLPQPQNSLVKVDLAGLGCVMVSRELLKKIQFKSGIDKEIEDVGEGTMLLDESGDFSNQVYSLGYDIYADGDVVCDHLC